MSPRENRISSDFADYELQITNPIQVASQLLRSIPQAHFPSADIQRFVRLTSSIRVGFAIAALFATASAGSPAKTAGTDPNVEWEFHSLVPLGSEALELMPAREQVVLLATAEAAPFEGWRRVLDGRGKILVGADG